MHVNHGIRGEEAIRDREFCRGFCRDRGIPFFCLDADVPAMRQQGESLETAARRVRYGYFAAVMGEQDYPLLAVAHNADDNLETVLFRICRGTGLRGLCGIPPVRAFGSGYLVRPLLGVSREEILRYLGERELSYVTDSTNEETDAGAQPPPADGHSRAPGGDGRSGLRAYPHDASARGGFPVS